MSTERVGNIVLPTDPSRSNLRARLLALLLRTLWDPDHLPVFPLTLQMRDAAGSRMEMEFTREEYDRLVRGPPSPQKSE